MRGNRHQLTVPILQVVIKANNHLNSKNWLILNISEGLITVFAGENSPHI